MATTLTYEEWLRLPEVEGIEETVNGEIRKTPPYKLPHAFVVDDIAGLLREKVERGVIQVYTSVFGLVIRRDPVTVRVPDLAVFVRENIIERDGYIHSAPELIVEVLSPGNTRAEREEKLADYASLGVPEVWVVSPEAQTVEGLTLQDGRLVTTSLLRAGELTPRQFPDARIDIAAIWPK